MLRKLKEMNKRENRDEMRRYLRAQEIDAERCDASCIRTWILGALKMRKLVKEGRANDIRCYFVSE